MKIMVEIPQDAFEDGADFLFDELFVRQYGQPLLRDLGIKKKAIVKSILSNKEALKEIGETFLNDVVDYYGDEFQECFDVDCFPEVEKALERCWAEHRDREFVKRLERSSDLAVSKQQWIDSTIAELEEYGYKVVRYNEI